MNYFVYSLATLLPFFGNYSDFNKSKCLKDEIIFLREKNVRVLTNIVVEYMKVILFFFLTIIFFGVKN